MRDTIYRDEAIEAIDKRIQELMSHPQYRRKGFHVDLYGAKELLRELSSADRWIPCSERMPEEREWIGTEKFGTTISDEVFVTFESRGERFVKPICFQNGELGGMDKHTMDAFFGEWKAVAWMPLPKPYKEDDK